MGTSDLDMKTSRAKNELIETAELIRFVEASDARPQRFGVSGWDLRRAWCQ